MQNSPGTQSAQGQFARGTLAVGVVARTAASRRRASLELHVARVRLLDTTHLQLGVAAQHLAAQDEVAAILAGLLWRRARRRTDWPWSRSDAGVVMISSLGAPSQGDAVDETVAERAVVLQSGRERRDVSAGRRKLQRRSAGHGGGTGCHPRPSRSRDARAEGPPGVAAAAPGLKKPSTPSGFPMPS